LRNHLKQANRNLTGWKWQPVLLFLPIGNFGFFNE